METEAWIIDAVRSPRGKGKENGALHNVHPQRILAQVLNALRDRNGFDTANVDDVVMGCGAGSGDHSMDIARMAALDAGWSLDAPAGPRPSPCSYLCHPRGCSSMAERELPKLHTGVRFPSPALADWEAPGSASSPASRPKGRVGGLFLDPAAPSLARGSGGLGAGLGVIARLASIG